ncbi:nucleotide exchange factors-like protein [Hysterangium stoloniferum]|nr:nucleotide exchange factors-like protein [Hysterangium stoloniferum]
MESLLRWGIENSAGDVAQSTRPVTELDPGVIDMILGKPEAVLMKEALAVGIDESRDVSIRVSALDDLEMLVEHIDNANNLTPLQMYPQILSLLSPKSPDEVRMQALWILGTAVQNNPQAQADFLKHDPLPLIVSILSPSEGTLESKPSPETRSKAAYTLSGALKHNANAVKRLEEVGGWGVLKAALQDSDITIRRKIVFLLNALLLTTEDPDDPDKAPTAPFPVVHHHTLPSEVSAEPNIRPHGEEEASQSSGHDPVVGPTSTTRDTLAALKKYNVVSTLVESLASPLLHGPNADQEGDADYEEKAARALVTYIEVGGELNNSEKRSLRPCLEESNKKTAWGLDDDAWGILKRTVLG